MYFLWYFQQHNQTPENIFHNIFPNTTKHLKIFSFPENILREPNTALIAKTRPPHHRKAPQRKAWLVWASQVTTCAPISRTTVPHDIILSLSLKKIPQSNLGFFIILKRKKGYFGWFGVAAMYGEWVVFCYRLFFFLIFFFSF